MESFDEENSGLACGDFLNVFRRKGQLGIGNEHAGAVPLDDDTLFCQLVENPPDGRRIQLQLFRKVPNGRQFVAGLEPLGHDQPFDFQDGLPVERFATVIVEFDFHIVSLFD